MKIYYGAIPYVGGWVVQKSLKTPLHNLKVAPYETINETMLHTSFSLVAMSTYLVSAQLRLQLSIYLF